MDERSFFTSAVHAGHDRAEHFGASSVPIYCASLFAFDDADEGIAIHNYEKRGYFYGRLGNPTQTALESAMAELEGGEAAVALASGMAAISGVILSLVEAGGHIIAPRSMYSTTTNLMRFLERFGIQTTFVDATDAEAYAAAMTPETKMLWVETPSNARVSITDLRRVAEIARDAGAITVADNTFATPFNQRPLAFGIDAVIHSATKYLGGHSDLTAGVVVGSSDLVEKVRHGAAKFFGGNIAPQVAWLVLRGIKTLALRMERHNSNAAALAVDLATHPAIRQVFYPGLESHQNHSIARGQMSGFGGMMSVDVGTAEVA